jgi:hypothetical protein
VKAKGREENGDSTGNRKERERITRETHKKDKAKKEEIIFQVTFDK